MRLIRYLKGSVAAVLVIVALLIVQAFTDLAIPRFTSDIVDVGIQQSGIEHASVEEMRAETYRVVSLLVDASDEALLQSSYRESGKGTYVLTDEGRQRIDELDRALSVPMAYVGMLERADSTDIDHLKQAFEQGTLSREDAQAKVDQMLAELGDGSDALVYQQALAAAKAEYEALGWDVAGIQSAYLWRVGLRMLALAALGMSAAIGVGFVASRTAAGIAANLRARLYGRVLSFSHAEVARFSPASLITRGTNDIQLIQMVEVMLLRMVLYAPILAIGGIVMIATTNVSMGWVIALAVVAIFVIIGLLMSIAMPKFKIMQYLVDGVNRTAREMLVGLPVIRAFNRQNHEQGRFDKASRKLMDTQLFTNRVMTFMMPAMMLIMNATSVAIVWVGASYVDAGTIQTGDLIAFITYSMVVIMSFLVIGMISIMLPRANVAAERVDEVLGTQGSIVDPEKETQVANIPASAAVPLAARIEFRDVSFRYGEGSELALDQVSFVAEAGKTTAIIGSTGSGKSTICRLIERFYDATEGQVLFDGTDVRNMSQRDLRRQIGYVGQQAFLFSGTVESNVAYTDGGRALDPQRMLEALSIAQAADFVSGMDGGIAAPISQGGTNVSGGQRQRLSIARALYPKVRAYVFDDSFSALDYKTESALRREMAKHTGGATVVLVAQRIASVMHADSIVVLDEGRVVGQGSHRELLETCEAYREIAQSQLSPEELKPHVVLAKGGDAR
ncbi:ABC transporter ATP-binding protein [Adlercreutzia sp. ZJ138]|uniref:ABC transporter ATP-binding protein n=1 Tax=Adlercreutzia sp. ZJ138 TaxID=2709405 RepID=UPI0013EACD1F|nr:ABC transporter ATP-binding protein [Adlercreutzia sp. ZJ138]